MKEQETIGEAAERLYPGIGQRIIDSMEYPLARGAFVELNFTPTSGPFVFKIETKRPDLPWGG